MINLELFHLSAVKLNTSKEFHPRTPTNYLVDNGFENGTIARISAVTDIGKALSAIHTIKDGTRMYVYRVVGSKPRIMDSNELTRRNLVPDANWTKEVWILDSVRFELVGSIEAKIPTKKGKGYSEPILYQYGIDKNGKPLNGQVWYWDYKWINKSGY